MAHRRQRTPLADSPSFSKRRLQESDKVSHSPESARKRPKRGQSLSQTETAQSAAEPKLSGILQKPNGEAVNGDKGSSKVFAIQNKSASPSSGVKRSNALKATRGKKANEDALSDEETQLSTTASTPANKRAQAAKSSKSPQNSATYVIAANEINGSEEEERESSGSSKPKAKKKRKTKEQKEAEAMPIAARTVGSRLFIGAHVSAAGGVHNAVTNSLYIGANAFALFQKSQRKWENPSIKPEHANEFKSLCGSHGYSSAAHVVPHGSYLVNLAARDPAKAKQAYDAFLDDLRRSESLGIKLYNFHPGNTNGEPRDQAIKRVAQRLNEAHKATTTVVTLLENMAASPSGNTLGGCFEDLAAVIDLIDDKSRVGICLDTCHAFAAGFDLRSPEAYSATMATLENVVGFHYLRAVHMNDSKAPLSSHRDLHQNIGCGFLGLRAFHNLVNDSRFAGLPLILETPIDKKNEFGKSIEDKRVWAREIKLLESLVDMDAEGDEFKRLEKELADKGAAERVKYQQQFDTKIQKGVKKGGKGRAKRAETESDSEEDE